MNAGEKLSDLCIYMMRTSNLHGDTFAGLLIKRLPEFDVGWEGLMGVYQHLLIRAGKIEIRPDDEQEKNNSPRTVERYERVLEPIRKRLLSLDDVATLRRLYALILDGEGMEEDVNFVKEKLISLSSDSPVMMQNIIDLAEFYGDTEFKSKIMKGKRI